MKIIGIDVGCTNLALVKANVIFTQNMDISVIFAQMFDLKQIVCRTKDCIFTTNDKSSAHRCHHWVEMNENVFKGTDLILMERQPLVGLTGVEQSIYIYLKQRFSDGLASKIRLISPNSMHAFFNMSKLKEERRQQIVNITKDYLLETKAFQIAKEKDHLADAFGFILFYCKSTLKDNMTPNPFQKYAYEAKQITYIKTSKYFD